MKAICLSGGNRYNRTKPRRVAVETLYSIHILIMTLIVNHDEQGRTSLGTKSHNGSTIHIYYIRIYLLPAPVRRLPAGALPGAPALTPRRMNEHAASFH